MHGWQGKALMLIIAIDLILIGLIFVFPFFYLISLVLGHSVGFLLELFDWCLFPSEKKEKEKKKENTVRLTLRTSHAAKVRY